MNDKERIGTFCNKCRKVVCVCNNEEITVQRAWLEELLAKAIRADDAMAQYNFTDDKNGEFLNKCSFLIGYAKSAQYILFRNQEPK
jgi:hypothetical protein